MLACHTTAQLQCSPQSHGVREAHPGSWRFLHIERCTSLFCLHQFQELG